MQTVQTSSKNILSTLSKILEIQELDMKMIHLMKLKNERQKEIRNVIKIKEDLEGKVKEKEKDVAEVKLSIRFGEEELKETKERLQQLEERQSTIKKVDEFNALNQEMNQIEKQRIAKEHQLSELYDKLSAEEDLLKSFKESLESTIESGKVLEKEINERIAQVNAEGRKLKTERDQLVNEADPEVFAIYSKLLQNKRDRVVVPIVDRTCDGCHIQLTAQDENLVRKAERLVFCEHCSRVLYWQHSEDLEGVSAVKTRRRRAKNSTSS
jgi:predicted  nucleic acid-binding Zn-ribbon protein